MSNAIISSTAHPTHAASQSLATDIHTFLSDFVTGRDVLDVGCADHSAENESERRWLHKHIVGAARSTTGLELLDAEAEKLRKRGYNVLTGDAATVNIGRTFDCIVAGEIIEHIDNPGAFIRNMRRHLDPSGHLIVTTPNPFFVYHQLEWLFLNSKLPQRWNVEHVSWFDPFTISNLLQRCGFTVEAIYYFTRSSKTLAALRQLGMSCPRPLATSFVAVARPM